MLTKSKTITLLQGKFQDKHYDDFSKKKDIYVLEGRPSLEASRHAIKEMKKRKKVPTLIADNMAGFLFSNNKVKEVNLAYQMKDKDGALCHIGGLILAVLAKKHRVPVKLHKGNGDLSLLGHPSDIFSFNGERVAPRGIQGYVPLVEWVPKRYISKIYE